MRPTMVQAGILGRLEDREAEHGWALDIGGQLSRLELLSGNLTDADGHGIESTRRILVEDVNRTLNKQNIRYNVPDIIPSGNHIREIVQEVLEVMHYRCTTAHIACLFIGIANCFLGIALTTGREDAEKVRRLALNRLNLLDLDCEDLGINSTALF
ncbi:hypothetical protein BGZ57DRAFT_892032, partial [Hyaloscypha finlandica]